MPLQNRVDPFSRIHAVRARGLFLGNRGILHDHTSQTLTRETWTTNGWVCCDLHYKGRHHPQMGEDTYTSLFFMDEAVALAAGHRPCFECRRDAARIYAKAASHMLGLELVLKAPEINQRIAIDIKPRIRKYGKATRQVIDPATLPNGAMFALEEHAYLKQGNAMRLWSFEGYGARQALPKQATRLTPHLSISALACGYIPLLHESANI